MSGDPPASARAFKLVLEYDGTDFAGWQAQREGQRTVQGVLEDALARLASGGEVRVTGAGRTDAGVHAEGQVAGLRLATRLEAPELLRALNATLPGDLAIVGCREVPAAFHARFDARGKHYRYRVWNGRIRSPLEERRALHVAQGLDLAAMERAGAPLVGTHDFAAFQGAGSGVRDTVRTLHALEVSGVSGHRVSFDLRGSGFLRHMVRNVVGTLLEVGRGQRPEESLAAILGGRERSAAGPTAPAHGLSLVRVDYADAQPGPAADPALHADSFPRDPKDLGGEGA